MAHTHSDQYVDEKGECWTFQHVLDDGGLRLLVTLPTGEERELRPRVLTLPRPSVDAETPLPLEIP